MKVADKLYMDYDGLKNDGPITIVAFGDSVTHGSLNGYISYETVYWNLLKQKINNVRDLIPVNIINAGIGGSTSTSSLDRMDKQVFGHNPDLVIVCFGLNDVNNELDVFLSSLRTIFQKGIDNGVDMIYMTPNMLNTYVAEGTSEQYYDYAHVTAEYQNNGRMDLYMDSAVKLAEAMGITVCDCYAKWKKMYGDGVDTTQLLINKINHPTAEMHKLFADSLFDIIFDGKLSVKIDKESDAGNVMYSEE